MSCGKGQTWRGGGSEEWTEVGVLIATWSHGDAWVKSAPKSKCSLDLCWYLWLLLSQKNERIGMHRVGSGPHWLHPLRKLVSLVAALRREGPVSCLGSKVELTPLTRENDLAGPKRRSVRDLVVPLICYMVGWAREKSLTPTSHPSPSVAGRREVPGVRKARKLALFLIRYRTQWPIYLTQVTL